MPREEIDGPPKPLIEPPSSAAVPYGDVDFFLAESVHFTQRRSKRCLTDLVRFSMGAGTDKPGAFL